VSFASPVPLEAGLRYQSRDLVSRLVFLGSRFTVAARLRRHGLGLKINASLDALKPTTSREVVVDALWPCCEADRPARIPAQRTAACSLSQVGEGVFQSSLCASIPKAFRGRDALVVRASI